MKIKLSEAAEFVGGKLLGNADAYFEKIAKIEEAQQGDLTFLYHPSYQKFLAGTLATAVLIKPDIPKTNTNINYIEVENPSNSLLLIINKFFKPDINLQGIDPSSFIDPGAVIGENTAIGKNVVISAGCRIGNNVKVLHNTVLLENVEIDDDSIIYQNVSIRENCKLGKRVIIHSGTVIGSDGFGYSPDEKGVYQKIPQIGNVIIEDDVELGSNVSVDRASLGSTIIKKGAKIDNLVQIAHNVIIGENTAISAQSGISGSTKVGKNCIFGGQVGIVGHVEITDNVLLGAQSGVSKGIPKSGTYFGSPAKEIKTTMKLEAHIRNLPNYSEKIKELEKRLNELQAKLNINNEKGDINA